MVPLSISHQFSRYSNALKYILLDRTSTQLTPVYPLTVSLGPIHPHCHFQPLLFHLSLKGRTTEGRTKLHYGAFLQLLVYKSLAQKRLKTHAFQPLPSSWRIMCKSGAAFHGGRAWPCWWLLLDILAAEGYFLRCTSSWRECFHGDGHAMPCWRALVFFLHLAGLASANVCFCTSRTQILH